MRLGPGTVIHRMLLCSCIDCVKEEDIEIWSHLQCSHMLRGVRFSAFRYQVSRHVNRHASLNDPVDSPLDRSQRILLCPRIASTSSADGNSICTSSSACNWGYPQRINQPWQTSSNSRRDHNRLEISDLQLIGGEGFAKSPFSSQGCI